MKYMMGIVWVCLDGQLGKDIRFYIKKRKTYIMKFIVLFIIFAYRGVFQFNSGKGKQFHYWVFNNYHLVLNIPNYNYNNIL